MKNYKIGKDQTYSREVNNRSILNLLMNRPYSGTELSSELSLSNATISSIIKSFLSEEIIKVSETSPSGLVGRRRVYYELNERFGLILCVNISNYHARITISNIRQEVIKDVDLVIAKYDSKAITSIILEVTMLLLESDIKSIPLRHIVVSLPGRVNIKTGELALSTQFDSELFSENHYIQNAFKKQFPNVPIDIVNDINLSALGELKCGSLKDVDNAIFISVDYGVGGALIFNNKIFHGDLGYCGEFGLLKFFDGQEYKYIDEFVSLRAIEEKLLSDSSVSAKKELIEKYKNDENVQKYVTYTASILGKSLKNLVEVIDISHVVISGAVINFGSDYLYAVNQEFTNLIDKPSVRFSSLNRDGEVIGGVYLGVSNILKNIAKRMKDE